jgi:hypothetical protein
LVTRHSVCLSTIHGKRHPIGWPQPPARL